MLVIIAFHLLKQKWEILNFNLVGGRGVIGCNFDTMGLYSADSKIDVRASKKLSTSKERGNKTTF